MMFHRSTEQASHYDALEQMSTHELLENINREDRSVPEVVGGILPAIEKVVDAIYGQLRNGGRLFYLGSGTSGRLGILDASECPPTYGVPFGLVIGLIAGGDQAIRRAVEYAEDSETQGWLDLEAHKADAQDFVVGITASGTTPYVIGAMKEARKRGIPTAGITCNAGAPLSAVVDYAIEAVVGPEFVTGSTRMKAGTAQKLILNMISTSVMVKLGRVKGNKMVDMQLSNVKLVGRGTRMIMEETGLSEPEAQSLLLQYGSVREALIRYREAGTAG
jgi:N-acetylmuramic acid 6-phosphate etherase